MRFLCVFALVGSAFFVFIERYSIVLVAYFLHLLLAHFLATVIVKDLNFGFKDKNLPLKE